MVNGKHALVYVMVSICQYGLFLAEISIPTLWLELPTRVYLLTSQDSKILQLGKCVGTNFQFRRHEPFVSVDMHSE